MSSLTRGIAGGVSSFLPSQVTGLFDPQRDFAYLKLPVHGVKSIVGISSLSLSLSLSRFPKSIFSRVACVGRLTDSGWDRTSPQIMVVTSEGLFYSYLIDLEKGGECILQKSYSLLDGIDSGGSSSSSVNNGSRGGGVANGGGL